MNIICNNCGGADIYNLKKAEFNNPFIWSVVFADDMIKLVSNYNEINFNNYEPIILTETIAKENNYDRFNPTITGILIDNKIRIYYTHYLYSSQKKPTKCGPDILYFKNYEYAYEKFEKRNLRMLNNKEEPVFLIFSYKRHGWTKEKIQKLISMPIKYKVVLITDEKIITENKNLAIITIKKLNELYKLPLSAIKVKQEIIFKELGI